MIKKVIHIIYFEIIKSYINVQHLLIQFHSLRLLRLFSFFSNPAQPYTSIIAELRPVHTWDFLDFSRTGRRGPNPHTVGKRSCCRISSFRSHGRWFPRAYKKPEVSAKERPCPHPHFCLVTHSCTSFIHKILHKLLGHRGRLREAMIGYYIKSIDPKIIKYDS